MDETIAYLQDADESAVRFPVSEEEMRELAALVQNRERSVNNVIGFVDGLSVSVQCTDETLTQNAYYNGYHHDTHVNNVFAFSAKGKIIYASYNFPGSWHDAQVSQQLMLEVREHLGTYALCVDQGFPRGSDMEGLFVGPMSRKRRRELSPIVADLLRKRHEAYVSLRQAAEWGMRALQGSFSRLKSRMTSNSARRKRIIQCIILLHNYRVHYVGMNQIAAVFDREYQQYLNVDGYDRIAKYFN